MLCRSLQDFNLSSRQIAQYLTYTNRSAFNSRGKQETLSRRPIELNPYQSLYLDLDPLSLPRAPFLPERPALFTVISLTSEL